MFTIQTFMLNDILISISKKPIKNIILRIDRQGAVKVSAPIRCSLKRVKAFITEKEEWIKTHVVRREAQSKSSIVRMQAGESCSYLGHLYPFKIYETHHRSSIHFEEDHIACFVKPTATDDEKQRLLQQGYRSQMKAILPDFITKWERIIGVQVMEWGIKSMKSRWGSCNTIKKRIWLNLNLMQKPLVCLEYVLVHEMVHLLEPSHNRRFHALMSQFMPEWKTYKRLLNEVSNVNF